MVEPITGISSMATRRVLAELARGYELETGKRASIEAVGGVDAAKRVRAGERFDLVVLAADVMAKLGAENFLLPGTLAAFVRSPMALAVKAGAPRPNLADAKSLQAAFAAARSVGYSTGPSGTHLLEVAKKWRLDPNGERPRFVQAKPGVPVAALVASGGAEIGVQQLSEFLDEPGIDIVGLAPPPLQSVTTFSVGIGARSGHVREARALIGFLTAPSADLVKRRFGMEPG